MGNSSDTESITSQDLVTEKEVKKTLLADKGKDAQLILWKVVNFTNKGDNYATVVTSVEVKYCLNKQEQDVTYVIKINPCRSFVGMEKVPSAIFMKETKFYTDLLPELNSALEAVGQEPLRLPRCFHATLETEKEQIYLEDLRARGFQMYDRRKGMSKDHVTLVLKELARLHAASHLLQAKDPEEALEVKYEFLLKDYLTLTENSKASMLTMLQSQLTNAVDMLTKVGGYERAITWVEAMKPKVEDIFTTGMRSEKFDNVGHGDCWNNNVLFRNDDDGKPVEVMLLDLQVCRKASVAVDLNYFLFTSLTGDVRRPNLKEFMSIYHSSYKGVVEAGGLNMHFTEDELLKEFRDKNTLGALLGMMVLPAVVMESDEVPDLSDQNLDMEKLMKDFKDKLMGLLDSNPLMKSRFLAMFDDLMEIGLIS